MDAFPPDGPTEQPATAPRPPLPPFDEHSAATKVRMAENAWNTRNPEVVALAYSLGSSWRNRDVFLQGRDEITAFLIDKWRRELDYRLIKELWAHSGDRIAVRFAYEWHDGDGRWFRSYGNENWQFDADGLMHHRHASINDLPIDDNARLFHWDRSGPRPADHPGLSELGL
jgi:nuclear transport factor 2 (NTF2) superfamily protein